MARIHKLGSRTLRGHPRSQRAATRSQPYLPPPWPPGRGVSRSPFPENRRPPSCPESTRVQSSSRSRSRSQRVDRLPEQRPTEAVLCNKGLPIPLVCREQSGLERLRIEGVHLVILDGSTLPVLDRHPCSIPGHCLSTRPGDLGHSGVSILLCQPRLTDSIVSVHTDSPRH